MDEIQKIKISSLPEAVSVSEDDCMLVVQNRKAKKASPALFKGAPGEPGESAHMRFYGDYLQWKVGVNGTWINLLPIKDITGPSAYEIAVKHGFRGTEAQWVASLSAASEAAAEVALEAARKADESRTLFTAEEAKRATAESGRVTAENNRVSTENNRVTAENQRADNESKRVTAENERVSAESARKTAETGRENTESTRVQAETARTQAEQTRNQNEETRQSNETARINAESARASAETVRNNAETARSQAETTRNQNEETRQSNETTRINAESTRASAETARNNAETARVQAESGRVIADQKREENTRQALEDTGKATDRLNELSDNRDKVIDGYWWTYNEETKAYEHTGEIAKGNIMYATFAYLDGRLYMRTDLEYDGPKFRMDEYGRLKVIV